MSKRMGTGLDMRGPCASRLGFAVSSATAAACASCVLLCCAHRERSTHIPGRGADACGSQQRTSILPQIDRSNADFQSIPKLSQSTPTENTTTREGRSRSRIAASGPPLVRASQHPWIVHRWGWIPKIAIGEALESSTNFHIAAVVALLGLWFAPTERKKCGLKLCTWARGGRMHGCELAGGGHQNRGLCLVLVLWS